MAATPSRERAQLGTQTPAQRSAARRRGASWAVWTTNGATLHSIAAHQHPHSLAHLLLDSALPVLLLSASLFLCCAAPLCFALISPSAQLAVRHGSDRLRRLDGCARQIRRLSFRVRVRLLRAGRRLSAGVAALVRVPGRSGRRALAFDIGDWAPNLPAPVGPQWPYIDSSNKDAGVALTMQGAVQCWAVGYETNFVTVVHFVCAAEQGPLTIASAQGTCTQIWTLPTPLACRGSPIVDCSFDGYDFRCAAEQHSLCRCSRLIIAARCSSLSRAM